jgi:hypothetical protein
MSGAAFDLGEIDRLREAATPQPWTRCTCGKCGLVWSDPAQTTVLESAAPRAITKLCGEDNGDCEPISPEQQQVNGELIVSLINSYPAMAARIRELEKLQCHQCGCEIAFEGSPEQADELRGCVTCDSCETPVDADEHRHQVDTFMAERERHLERIRELEAACAGVRDEKKKELLMVVRMDRSPGSISLQGGLEAQIAWLDSLLGAGQ